MLFIIACRFVTIAILATAIFLSASGLEAQQNNFDQKYWQQKSKEILHQLGGDDLNAAFGLVPEITFYDSPEPNAFQIDRGGIIISTGLLLEIQSDSELGFVIAHELGHMVSDRFQGLSALKGNINVTDSLIRSEVLADRFAIRLIANSKLSPESAVSLLSRLEKSEVKNGITLQTLYPSLRIRRAELDKYLKSRKL